MSTIRVHTRTGNFKVKKARFTKVISGYDMEHFMQGGPANHIEKITL